ncbi:MAG: hypothetical protein WCP45_08400 [Verrucomicrobiota bacterium]
MNPATIEPPRLVALPREQYLRKEEARIRSLSLPARNSDPQVETHLSAVLGAEELIDIHESAAIRQAAQGAKHFADAHKRFASIAWQIKLYHLNALSNLVL